MKTKLLLINIPFVPCIFPYGLCDVYPYPSVCYPALLFLRLFVSIGKY